MIGEEREGRERMISTAPSNPARLNSAYFGRRAPCTMLIDEVETIWAAIADDDDWSLLGDKADGDRGKCAKRMVLKRRDICLESTQHRVDSEMTRGGRAMRIFLIISMLFVAGCLPADQPNQIIVDGEAVVEITPDNFRLTATLRSRQDNEADALAEISAALSAIRENLPGLEGLTHINIDADDAGVRSIVDRECRRTGAI